VSGCSAEWNQDDKIEKNYESLGFVANVNRNYGRNARADTLEEKILAVQECDDDENGNINDEDLKAALGKIRSSGKAPPPRPSPRQRDLIERLVSVHGNDIEAMVRDRKLNSMQQSAGQLKKLIDGCAYWSSRQAGVDFRVPNKKLW
jgi:nucleolar protein 16